MLQVQPWMLGQYILKVPFERWHLILREYGGRVELPGRRRRGRGGRRGQLGAGGEFLFDRPVGRRLRLRVPFGERARPQIQLLKARNARGDDVVHESRSGCSGFLGQDVRQDFIGRPVFQGCERVNELFDALSVVIESLVGWKLPIQRPAFVIV